MDIFPLCRSFRVKLAASAYPAGSNLKFLTFDI
jgi:hypothetical protein